MNREKVLTALQNSINLTVTGQFVLTEDMKLQTLYDEANIDSIDEIEIHMCLEEELQIDINDKVSVDMFRTETVGDAITCLLASIQNQ